MPEIALCAAELDEFEALNCVVEQASEGDDADSETGCLRPTRVCHHAIPHSVHQCVSPGSQHTARSTRLLASGSRLSLA